MRNITATRLGQIRQQETNTNQKGERTWDGRKEQTKGDEKRGSRSY